MTACIYLHNFAIAHEQGNINADGFFLDGQRLMDEDREATQRDITHNAEQLTRQEAGYLGQEKVELLDGKLKREELHEAIDLYLQEKEDGMIF